MIKNQLYLFKIGIINLLTVLAPTALIISVVTLMLVLVSRIEHRAKVSLTFCLPLTELMLLEYAIAKGVVLKHKSF